MSPASTRPAIDLECKGPDLIVTAPRPTPVRVNWRALHLEGAQRDYQLRLRLGFSLAYDALRPSCTTGCSPSPFPSKTAVAAAAVA